jgi:hypothetical protein
MIFMLYIYRTLRVKEKDNPSLLFWEPEKSLIVKALNCSHWVVIATLELSISYNFQHTAIYFQVFCTRFSRLDRTNIIQFVNCYSGSIPLCFCFPFSTTVRAYFVYCFELNNRYGTLTLTKSFWWFNSISILLLIQLVRGYKLDLHVFFSFPFQED